MTENAMPQPRLFLAHDDSQIESCFDAFSALRPHVRREAFLTQIRRQQAQGFQVLALEQNGLVKSVAGFRTAEFLAWGRVIYIDDLSTLPEARGQGFGGMLLDWLAEYARQQECNALHLDTGYARHVAHRLYLNKGFELNCHHMTKVLE